MTFTEYRLSGKAFSHLKLILGTIGFIITLPFKILYLLCIKLPYQIINSCFEIIAHIYLIPWGIYYWLNPKEKPESIWYSHKHKSDPYYENCIKDRYWNSVHVYEYLENKFPSKNQLSDVDNDKKGAISLTPDKTGLVSLID